MSPPPAESSPRSLTGVLVKLAAANYALAVLSVVTAPLQARALGPAGRGDLAAIIVPLGLLPPISTLGFGSYAVVATARGVSEDRVAGTVGALLLGCAALLMALAFPIASTLAEGRETVHTFLVIGLLLAPITLSGLLALDIAIGLGDWTPILRNRVASALISSVPIPVLYAFGVLTVTTAAVTALATILAFVFPWRAMLRRRPKLVFDRAILREALSFGPRSWIGGLAQLSNSHLDQLLMIKFVSPGQLGLYAISVSFATFLAAPATTALVTASTARVVQRDAALVMLSSRLSVLGGGTLALGLSVISPIVLPLMFGHAFRGAVTVCVLLCIANMPAAVASVLAAAVSNMGKPGVAARSEMYSLLITVPGLLLTLRAWGIEAAAVISIAAYTFSAGYLLRATRRELGGTVREFLVPTRADLHEFRVGVSRLLSRAPWVGRSTGP